VWGSVSSPKSPVLLDVSRPVLSPPTLTHNELRQVVRRVPLLPLLGRGLHLRGLTVQIGLSQRLHDAALSTHKRLSLLQRHCLVQVGALG
jgi:hypothetical protein